LITESPTTIHIQTNDKQHPHIRLHSKGNKHTITKLNNNINMERLIAELITVKDCMNMDRICSKYNIMYNEKQNNTTSSEDVQN
jgi:hypothetical protein